ncbi:MAG TPA: acetyltransferase [Tepidisphaeraceae bacterium]|jgi:UDP-perosamine 4-acetyltransferase
MDIVIIGAGGHGKVVLDAVLCAGRDQVIGFLDADPATHGRLICGVEVLGSPNALARMARGGARGVIVAIGNNRVRQQYAVEAAAGGIELVNAIHPAATVSRFATVGRNVFVAAGAVVCADARLADGVVVNTAAVVDHECDVATAAHLCPGAVLTGRVRVGERAFVGAGARVLPCLRIGSDSVVGAGAVVRADVPDGTTAVGVPARLLNSNKV